MIPRLRPQLTLCDVVAAFAGRNAVEEFETVFAETMQQAHAVAFPYGRTAQLLLLEAMGLKDREIILPAYTCVVVAHAIVLSGNRPVFIDSEPGGFNMDLDLAEAAVTERTGAIMATSIHGYPVDLDRLDAIREKHPHVAILQDCAHSFAGEWQGRPVQKAGLAAIFGLNVSKLMTSIFGGMITTDDDELAARLRETRSRHLMSEGGRNIGRAVYLTAATAALSPPVFGMVKRISEMGLIDRFIRYYDESLIDMPKDYLSQIGRAEASVGVRQSRRYRVNIQRRRELAAYYDASLRDVMPNALPPLIDGATYSHYVLRVDDPETYCSEALRRGVELGRLIDYCVPDMPSYRELARGQGPFPETHRLNRTVLNIPIWGDKAMADRVIGVVKDIAQSRIVRHS